MAENPDMDERDEIEEPMDAVTETLDAIDQSKLRANELRFNGEISAFEAEQLFLARHQVRALLLIAIAIGVPIDEDEEGDEEEDDT